jgi:phosphoesterase RecJ-like protein
MTENVKNAAPKILELIKASKNILLHCHIFPDCDSIGSALAMKFALEQLGKKVTLIRGDSKIPEVFSRLPGAAEIIPKNFFEIDRSQFDLFLILDSGSPDRISQVKGVGEVFFPETMKTVNVDHHVSNLNYARDFNLVETEYPSTTLILFDLFKEWGIKLTHDISLNLFMGIYTDTGGFRFQRTTPETFLAAAELVRNAPDFSDFLFTMDNSRNRQELLFQGAALGSIETFLGGFLAIASVSTARLQELGIVELSINGGTVANIIKSAIGWDIGVCVTELAPGNIKVSFRTRDDKKYDLAKITESLGGGGHKAAAGVVLRDISLDEAKKKIVAAVEEYIKGKITV